MASELVNLRLPPDLLRSVRTYAKKGGYKNIQEYIREALREKTTKEIIIGLGGAFPQAKPVTRKSREAAARALYEEKGWDYDSDAQGKK